MIYSLIPTIQKMSFGKIEPPVNWYGYIHQALSSWIFQIFHLLGFTMNKESKYWIENVLSLLFSLCKKLGNWWFYKEFNLWHLYLVLLFFFFPIDLLRKWINASLCRPLFYNESKEAIILKKKSHVIS